MGFEESTSAPGIHLSSVPADRVGIWASALCIVHCTITPVLLSYSAVFAHFLPSEEKVHRSLAVGIAAIGLLALLRGYRKHRRKRVWGFMGTGLGLIFAAAWWGDHLPSHWMEVVVNLLGSSFMILAHRTNHTFCRDCACAKSS